MQPMEQYRDASGRLRKRRARCCNHGEKYADAILAYKTEDGHTIYHPVCDPCREVYEDYDERLRPALDAVPEPTATATRSQRMCGACGAWVSLDGNHLCAAE